HKFVLSLLYHLFIWIKFILKRCGLIALSLSFHTVLRTIVYNYYTCGPSTRFFFLKSIGFLSNFLPLRTSRNREARNNEEYLPSINPTKSAIAKTNIDCAPSIKKASTAIIVVIVVLILRINV